MTSDRMEYLVNQLNYYTEMYDKGMSVISDKEYDDLYFELLELEKNTGKILKNSPTQKIYYNIVNSLEKVKHNHEMLSAAKTKDWDEFVSYFGIHDVIGMLKLDGLTLSVEYRGGRLVGAETRGNGIEGENVLHNAMVIRSIPKIIDYKEDLIVDGEIICTYKDFEPFSNDYANPRNFASGSIRLLDNKECERRNLTFVAWNVVKGLTNNLIDNFNELKKLGFIVTPWTSSFDWDAKDFLIDKAKEFGYPIDGLIGRFMDREYGESLGSTDHHTRAIYAFKFYDEEYETELLDIEWSLGRTGVLTPVAIYKDVDTGDSIINRASLHNVSVLSETLGIPFKGQKIKVCKQNEIIPQITWAEEWKMDKPFLVNAIACPICGAPTIVKNNDGVKTLWCSNSSCSGKLSQKITHYCDRTKGLDIRGLSEKTIDKLMAEGWLNEISDLYTLKEHYADWIKLEGFGEKSVTNILNAIEKSKKCKLENFISAFGIPLIGVKAAKEIIKYYPTWNDFISAIGGKWSDLEGFGPEMEKSLNEFDYAQMKKIAEMLDFLQPEVLSKESLNATAAGLTFCITGKVNIWKNRDSLKLYIESIGGKVVGSMSSKVNYLINNDNTSTTSKNLAAKKAGIPIITEAEFVEVFGQN